MLAQIDAAMHRFDLEANDLAARQLRRELEKLQYDFDEDTVDLLKLAATEMVTNAVIHSGAADSGGRVIVYVRVGSPSLLVKVCDRGPGVHQPATKPDVMSEGGRGLFLVDTLTKSWGTSKVEIDGETWSCVWACFGEEALPDCVNG